MIAVLVALISILVSGLIIGLLARFAVPGPDPLPIWKTILLGIVGSIVGGVLASLLGVIDDDDVVETGEAVGAFLCSLAGAILLLILYRRIVQKRGITGPDSNRL